MTSELAMQTGAQRDPKEEKFCIIVTDIRGDGPGHGVVIANEERLLTPPRLIIRPEGGGFASSAEPYARTIVRSVAVKPEGSGDVREDSKRRTEHVE